MSGRNLLRILALLLAIAGLSIWIAGGAHRGWTKTSGTVMKTDPVTEIVYPEVEKKFTPGVEFPAGGLAGGMALVGISFFFRRAKAATGNRGNPIAK
jgi:hypothetical protein